MRLPSFLIFLFSACLTLSVQGQQRADLHLFKYGRTTLPQRDALFQDFRYVLAEKMPRLSDELGLGDALPVLNALRVVPVTNENNQLRQPTDLIGNLQLRQKYWRDVGALALLTGMVIDHGTTPYIQTTLYWGQLKPPLSEKMIDLQLPLSGNYFDTTFDSHSVAILYAIANQPDISCNQFTSVIAVLNEAYKRAKSVAQQQPELGAKLTDRIVNSIESLRAECHR